MYRSKPPLSATSLALIAAVCLSTSTARAANSDFQSFYRDQACANASGNMSARCATEGADLSGDSESSLTPSHMLSAGDATLLSEQAEQSGLSSQLTQIGPLSISAQAGVGEIVSERDNVNRERSYTTDIEQLAVTFDYRLSDTLVTGAILSLQRSELEFDALSPTGAFPSLVRAGRYDSDTLGLTGFVSYAAENELFIDGALGYSTIDNEFERESVFQPTSRAPGSAIRVTTSADVDGSMHMIQLRTGRHYSHGKATFTPQASYHYSQTETDGYTESDDNSTGLAMRYQSFTQTSSLLSLGSDMQFPINTNWGVLSLQGGVHYYREFDREDEKVKASFANDQAGSQFVVEGEEPDQSYFQASLGAVLQFSHGWSSYLIYSRWLGHSEYDQFQTSLGIRKEL